MVNKKFRFPQELEDKIFLYSNYYILVESREIQSDYVKNVTQYSDINAAHNGNLQNKDLIKVLVWLRDHGCPWGSHTFAHAAYNGNLENKDLIKVLVWLREQGCSWNANTFAFAAKNGKLENSLGS